MKVLYATDGLPAALAAGDLIRALFRNDGVDITVATVTPSKSLAPDDLLLELGPIEELRKQSGEIASAAVELFEGAGFTAAPLILEGKPGPELVRAADEGGFDVIVVGEGGPPSIGRRLMGSVSTYVFRHASCSVFIVPPPTQ